MSKLIELSSDSTSGHFVEIDGHPVFISGPGPGKTDASRAKFHKGLAAHHAKMATNAADEGDHAMAAHHAAMSQGHAAAAKGDKAGMTKAAMKLSQYDPNITPSSNGRNAALLLSR